MKSTSVNQITGNNNSSNDFAIEYRMDDSTIWASYFGLEPRTKYTKGSCSSNLKSAIEEHWKDLLISFFMAATGFIVARNVTPYNRVFLENDPSLSYPYVRKALVEIPIWLLVVIGILFPIVALQCISEGLHIWRNNNPLNNSQHLMFDVYRPFVFIIESLSLCEFITGIMKIFAGRKRPNFFAMCNYKGYRLASDGNLDAMEAYRNSTIPGSFGDVKYCSCSHSELMESMKSFPSGHSSTAFAGLFSLSLFLYGVLKINLSHKMLKVLMITIPTLAATIISTTRPRDYWHNFDDILAGAMIGMISATLTFFMNFVDPNTLVPMYKRNNPMVQANNGL